MKTRLAVHGTCMAHIKFEMYGEAVVVKGRRLLVDLANQRRSEHWHYNTFRVVWRDRMEGKGFVNVQLTRGNRTVTIDGLSDFTWVPKNLRLAQSATTSFEDQHESSFHFVYSCVFAFTPVTGQGTRLLRHPIVRRHRHPKCMTSGLSSRAGGQARRITRLKASKSSRTFSRRRPDRIHRHRRRKH